MALRITDDIITPDDDENLIKYNLQYALIINIALCKMKCGNFRSAKQLCEAAIDVPEIPKTSKIKAYYRYVWQCMPANEAELNEN
jgi:hypothetical protein